MYVPGIYILGLRRGRRWGRERVARLTGLPADRQRAIEEGTTCPTSRERRAYAAAFGFASGAEFDDGWRSRSPALCYGDSGGRVPVINLAPAGEPGDYDEMYPSTGIGYAYIDPPPGICGPNLFAFVIAGSSMEPDYPSGQFAICRPTPSDEVADGQPAFVRFGAAHGHGCTFKRCCRVDRLHLVLRAINPAYPSRVVAKADVDRLAPVIACIAPSRTSATDDRGHRYFTEDSQIESDGNFGKARR